MDSTSQPQSMPAISPRPKQISHLINGHSPLHSAQTLESSHTISRTENDATYREIEKTMHTKGEKEAIPVDQLLSDGTNGQKHERQPSPPPSPPARNPSRTQQYTEITDADIENLNLNRITSESSAETEVEDPRDPRDDASPGDEAKLNVETPPTPPLTTPSRSASPFTQSPAVDFNNLSWPSRGTLSRLHEREQDPRAAQARLDKLSGAVRTILECIGEDPEREGLVGTPERYAKALMFFTKGYEENLGEIVNGAVFGEDCDELVIVKDIEVYSLCEHHLVPFTGKMHIGYIPSHRVIGLSKLARIAEMFSRRLQVQERLTKQVALALSEVLKPQGVAVVMESSHLCMVMRGVQKTGAVTTTSCMLGAMRKRGKTREEFLSLLNRR